MLRSGRGKGRFGKMCWGGVGKCVGVGGRCGESGKVWGGVENVEESCGSVFRVWGGVGKCVWGVGKGVGNVLG